MTEQQVDGDGTNLRRGTYEKAFPQCGLALCTNNKISKNESVGLLILMIKMTIVSVPSSSIQHISIT